MNAVTVLGLNCSHDAAAALAVDGTVVAAISEERLTRVKHQDDFPKRAISYCLNEAGLNARSTKLHQVVINEMPWTNYRGIVLDHFSPGTVEEVVVNPSHHYLHACYGEMLTDRRPLVILVVDGSGYSYAEHKRRGSPLLGVEPSNVDMWEALTAYYVGEDGSTSLLLKDWGEWRDHKSLRFPSLGHMYGLAAQHIFGSWTHAGKVMGLAPYGDPEGFGGKPIVTPTNRGIQVDTDWLLEVPRISLRQNPESLPAARDVAAKVQAELETGMMHLCRMLSAQTKCGTICLTGGVALNSVFNGRLAREGLFEKIVVSPASHDAGTAIGAAAYGYKRLTGKQLKFCGDPEFLGHTYSEADVLKAMEHCPYVDVTKIDNPLETAARELAAGKIVGWFEGAAEFGPRALGHRSILADPRARGMKDRLNSRVKFRESFRPYAAAVLVESCPEWFELFVESPHMLMVATVRPDKRELIPAVLHVDNTCRLQTVDKAYQGSLRGLIEAFYNITGVPLLLNTSFNSHGQPICETPEDALDCLVRSGLDVLYCGRLRAVKQTLAPSTQLLTRSRPVPSAGFYMVSRYEAKEGQTQLTESWVAQDNLFLNVTPEERDLLAKVTGRKTLDEIAREIPGQTLERVSVCVQSLCHRGILYLELPSENTQHHTS